ncbi:hypothetical protein [Acinetobacter haemolyticus]|uniref:hypothetical protein n=1 Tax=Acinetobacter haemolyticus TaxID=29430 RepID=UPI003AF77ECE
MIEEFQTITGNVVEVKTQNAESCRHNYIQPMPMQVDEMESKYQCYSCRKLFSAKDVLAIKFSHYAQTKPLSREDFNS